MADSQPNPSDYSDPGEFAAAWQAANPGGAQVDVIQQADGSYVIGETFFDDED